MLAGVSFGVVRSIGVGVKELIVCARLLVLGCVGDDATGPSASSAFIERDMLLVSVRLGESGRDFCWLQ